jgi:RHS repeat-associated protein
VTTYYVGNHYEVKNSVVTKYYFAGSTRLAVRTNGTLSYLLGDHIGSSSVTTDANGVKTASALYKAFGETRFSSGNLGTDYKFTGQREEASLGIYYFNARWMDPSLGRFTSPDTIVPTSTQGTQAWDRYAFVNNNPVRYNDPTGHVAETDVDQSQNNGQCDPAVTDCDQKPVVREDPTKCGNKNIGCESHVINGITYYRIWQNGTEIVVPYNKDTMAMIGNFQMEANNYAGATNDLGVAGLWVAGGALATAGGAVVTLAGLAGEIPSAGITTALVVGGAMLFIGGLIGMGAGIVQGINAYGSMNATEKTESNCIISGDGLGMASSWVRSWVNSTLPQVAHAIPSLHKKGQSPALYRVRILVETFLPLTHSSAWKNTTEFRVARRPRA